MTTTPHETPAPTLREALKDAAVNTWSDQLDDEENFSVSYYGVPEAALEQIEAALTAPLKAEIAEWKASAETEAAEADRLRDRLAKADKVLDEIALAVNAQLWKAETLTPGNMLQICTLIAAYDAVPACSAGALDTSSGHTTSALDTSSGHTTSALDIAASSAGEDAPNTSWGKGYADGHAQGVGELTQKIFGLIEQLVESPDTYNNNAPAVEDAGESVNLGSAPPTVNEEIDHLKERVAELEATVARIGEGAAWDANRIDDLDDRLSALEQPSTPVALVTDAMVDAFALAFDEYIPIDRTQKKKFEAIRAGLVAALVAQGSEVAK